MGRFLAGVASALLLVAAGVFLWKSVAGARDPVPLAPPEAGAPAPVALAPLADPPVASARTREERRFARYDKDDDDAITREEYLASRRKAYAKLDANGDGRLSFEEWAVKTTTRFATADTDRSGALNPAEFATTRIIRKSPARADCPPPGRGDDES